jgi:ABC-type enterochelin transport system ATPase subunit
MPKNPFTVSFSRKPLEYIERMLQTDQVIETFTEDPVTDQIFVITGLRGSGKTVLMSSIASDLEADKDWVVERAISTRDMVHELAVDLEDKKISSKADLSAEIDLPGIGSVSVGKNRKEKTDVMRIRESLKALDRKHKKLLITVDEISDTPQMRDLSSVFQELIGENLPIYFLGTAIQENLDAIRNVKYMTFLYRAPRIGLEPLDIASVALRYKEVLQISDEDSRYMAKLTRGYSFAFQALGYIYWNHKPVKNIDDLLPEYDRMLTENSYSKIWSELSLKQREVCRAIAKSGTGIIKDVRKLMNMDSNNFNGYRNRLLHIGIINVIDRGTIIFTLPRFSEFILEYSELYEFDTP